MKYKMMSKQWLVDKLWWTENVVCAIWFLMGLKLGIIFGFLLFLYINYA